MLNIRKILVPVVLLDTSRHVLQQAAWLARRLDAEVILLHVVVPPSYPVGMLAGGHESAATDLHERVVQRAQADLDGALWREFEGVSVSRVLLRGDPAHEIMAAARDAQADLIMMSTHGHGAFYRFLLGSVTAKVLHEVASPVWTGVHLEDAPAREFTIREVLCSADLGSHCHHTVKLAAEIAAAVYARLTLVHITASVEVFGPGGTHVDAEFRERLVAGASQEIASLQKDLGTNADVIIDSGNVMDGLNRAAERTKADVLVIGHTPGRSHLGDNGNGYGIIRGSQVPVLSV